MKTLEKLYNKTNLEEEIKDFYTKIDEDRVSYLKDVIVETCGVSPELIEGTSTSTISSSSHSLQIKKNIDEHFESLTRAVYKIPGEIKISSDNTKILM